MKEDSIRCPKQQKTTQIDQDGNVSANDVCGYGCDDDGDDGGDDGCDDDGDDGGEINLFSGCEGTHWRCARQGEWDWRCFKILKLSKTYFNSNLFFLNYQKLISQSF